MLIFTEQDIANLIACRKEVVDPPRREMKLEGKMKRNEMTLRSADKNMNSGCSCVRPKNFRKTFP